MLFLLLDVLFRHPPVQELHHASTVPNLLSLSYCLPDGPNDVKFQRFCDSTRVRLRLTARPGQMPFRPPADTRAGRSAAPGHLERIAPRRIFTTNDRSP